MVRLNVSVIRQLRMSRTWTIQRLADEANLNRRTVDRVEGSDEDEHEPHLATAAAIAEALEVDLSEIVLEGRPSMVAQEDDGDRVVAAFNAADQAIRRALSAGGEWGAKEASSVLSLLLARYGSAFAQKDVKNGSDLVQAAYDQAKRALPRHVSTD